MYNKDVKTIVHLYFREQYSVTLIAELLNIKREYVVNVLRYHYRTH